MKAVWRPGGACRIARRLTQIEMQRKQRRQEIVLKSRDLFADGSWHLRLIEKIDEGLRRVERGRDELPRADQLAVGCFDPHRAAILDHDASGLGHQTEVAAALARSGFERTRERCRT